MNKKTLKCLFLSDVVLNADTATEGSQKSLDYIPGSCFLGIVAKNYKDFEKEKIAYDIFHSGKVKFGDAHIAKNDKRTLKQPAMWFKEKGKDDGDIYINHLLDSDLRKELQNNEIQLKQVRSGYFNDEELVKVEHDFAIKSSYNADERRSSDGQLYGYDALRKGNEWIFSIESEDENLLAQVAEKLIGEHNIGRSKTAQYGRVKIELLKNYKEEIKSFNSDVTLIYFESCAAFIDEDGNPTYQPSIDDLGITGSIDWSSSQILRRSYAPYNATRKVRNADIVCIDKGSVIVVNGTVDSAKVANGVGIYQNEGFGKVIINPDFLQGNKKTAKFANPPTSKKDDNTVEITAIQNAGDDDTKIISWLKNQESIQSRYSEVVKKTNEFVKDNQKKFKRISSSQWGSIRERAQRETNLDRILTELFKEETGYLRHGKAESKWRNNYSILETAVKSVDKTIARRFLINLCSEMAKKKNQGEK